MVRRSTAIKENEPAAYMVDKVQAYFDPHTFRDGGDVRSSPSGRTSKRRLPESL